MMRMKDKRKQYNCPHNINTKNYENPEEYKIWRTNWWYDTKVKAFLKLPYYELGIKNIVIFKSWWLYNDFVSAKLILIYQLKLFR